MSTLRVSHGEQEETEFFLFESARSPVLHVHGSYNMPYAIALAALRLQRVGEKLRDNHTSSFLSRSDLPFTSFLAFLLTFLH